MKNQSNVALFAYKPQIQIQQGIIALNNQQYNF